MKEKIISLFGVRSIITLALTGTLIYGFVIGSIEAKDFLVYVTMVFTFFFAKKEQETTTEEKSNKEVG